MATMRDGGIIFREGRDGNRQRQTYQELLTREVFSTREPPEPTSVQRLAIITSPTAPDFPELTPPKPKPSSTTSGPGRRGQWRPSVAYCPAKSLVLECEDRRFDDTPYVVSIGDLMSHCDQLEAILDGLPIEYQALASIIRYGDEPCGFIVAETMLLSHEACLDRAPHLSPQDSLSVDLTQGNVTPTSHSTVSIIPDTPSQLLSQESLPQFDGTRGGRGGRSFNSRGGGRNGGKSHVQCQICSNIGHDAKTAPPSVSQWRAPPPGFALRPTTSPYASFLAKQPQAYLTDNISTSSSDQVMLGNGQGLLYSVFTSQPPGGDSTIGLGRGVVLEASLGLFRICELDYVKGVDT
ncbi:hypothetical protein KIW84_035344 [Lathyrus oleraceus]|uniref:Uncharacterized protein n=1 Tax=Pisum sativum TaxID=3888 RepID=A0A9D4Y6D1_PEA|nr:hypothetical protein KIW84_035344 [Pisum sativum]